MRTITSTLVVCLVVYAKSGKECAVKDRIFMGIEFGGDASLNLVEAQCATFTRRYPTTYFGDRDEMALPETCGGAAYRPCKAGANYGSNIATAQRKREHMHFQFLSAAPGAEIHHQCPLSR